ncbi:unnamed protein product [Clonostachys chloroleuca]|uniref:SnoaL-like domain-containing protein n=1 Tax=Clonostachys chloroleuca TaxID=1926264 RepID=A0AA35LS85_9HYPO|nr:unnamed protein product [Clonostachys chloroleuca]
MPNLHDLPEGWKPAHASRNNGPANLVQERFKLRELAEGWPMYRDSCEWDNMLSTFHPEAYIYTTWTGRCHHLDFITASKAGMDNGAFIMHRCHGASTDINPEATRAVTKMKATITQRFTIQGCEVDAESDCRFCFFWEKTQLGEWRARYVRHWYEKDKLIPVNPANVPTLDEEKLASFPPGYRYLAYCQEATMGVKVLLDMPGHRRNVGTINGEKHDELYMQCKSWVENKPVEI